MSRSRWRWPRRVAVTLTLLAVVGAVLFVYVGAHAIVNAPNHRRTPPPDRAPALRVAVHDPEAELAYLVDEPTDGIARGTVFVLHGIRDGKESLHNWARHLTDAGYRVVRPDARGQGHSSGDWMTYGVAESHDYSQLADALAAEGKLTPPLYAVGFSYGASTAITWAGREPRVRAVVAVAPFASLRAVIPAYLPRFVPVVGRFVPGFLVSLTLARAGRLAHFDVDEASALAAEAHTAAPILIIHGRDDEHIPVAQAEALAAAAPGHVKLVILDGESHETIARERHAVRWWPTALAHLAAVGDCATPAACVALGLSLQKAPVTMEADSERARADNARALKLFAGACAKDHARACELVGEMRIDHAYYGVPADGADAARGFDRACALGLGHACYRLGFYLWEGLLDTIIDAGAPRRFRWPGDRAAGAKLMHKACDEMREAKACSTLAEMHAAHVCPI